MPTKQPNPAKKYKYGLDLEKMMATGMHLGHRTSNLHPKMEDFILGIKNTVHVIDLKKTAEHLERSLNFVEKVIKDGGTLLLVGTKLPLRELIQKTAKDCNLPYVSERWLGGTLTNFEVITERVKYFKEMVEKKEKGELDKYTKKEKMKIEKELADLKVKFGGIKDMEKIPEAIFICDLRKDRTALKEAKMKGVKVVAICDTNVDPTQADWPIPANDDAISSVRYILEKVAQVVKKCKVKSEK